MGLLEEMHGESASKRNRLTELLARVAEDERDDLRAALHDRSITAAAIVKVLKRRGVEVTLDMIYGLRRRLRDESA